MMDENVQNTEPPHEVFMLVRIEAGTRQPYTPFSGTCHCGCGGRPGSCCCSN